MQYNRYVIISLYFSFPNDQSQGVFISSLSIFISFLGKLSIEMFGPFVIKLCIFILLKFKTPLHISGKNSLCEFFGKHFCLSSSYAFILLIFCRTEILNEILTKERT